MIEWGCPSLAVSFYGLPVCVFLCFSFFLLYFVYDFYRKWIMHVNTVLKCDAMHCKEACRRQRTCMQVIVRWQCSTVYHMLHFLCQPSASTAGTCDCSRLDAVGAAAAAAAAVDAIACTWVMLLTHLLTALTFNDRPRPASSPLTDWRPLSHLVPWKTFQRPPARPHPTQPRGYSVSVDD